jgi:hypothetical protein
MARSITIEFLTKARDRATVIIEYRPSWLLRLFGVRGHTQTTTAVTAHIHYTPPRTWVYEIDAKEIEDMEIIGALEWQRRWDKVVTGADFPIAHIHNIDKR